MGLLLQSFLFLKAVGVVTVVHIIFLIVEVLIAVTRKVIITGLG